MTHLQPESGSGEEGELALRLADAYAVIQASMPRNEDGEIDFLIVEDDGIKMDDSFFTVLDFALTGGQGCLDDEEFEARRRAALGKHRDQLNLPTQPLQGSEVERLRRYENGYQEAIDRLQEAEKDRTDLRTRAEKAEARVQEGVDEFNRRATQYFAKGKTKQGSCYEHAAEFLRPRQPRASEDPDGGPDE
jgi:hypothetical protein